MESFPHEGWCDLQFFEMIQDAPSLRRGELPGNAEAILRVIPIWRTAGEQAGPNPETTDEALPYATEDRVYLAESRLGRGSVLICSLNLVHDPAGWRLLEHLINYVSPDAKELTT